MTSSMARLPGALYFGWTWTAIAAAIIVVGCTGPRAGEDQPAPTRAVAGGYGSVPTVEDQPQIGSATLESGEEVEEAMALQLTSSAFEHGAAVPAIYTCDGEDISPALAWGEPPEGTQSFALIFDDPDAPGGTWVHWVLFNIPAGSRSLPEAIPPEATLADGSVHGTSSFGSSGYGGPCPPGGTHRYFFKLYALDTALDLQPGAKKTAVEGAMQGHVLGQAELMGTYSR